MSYDLDAAIREDRGTPFEFTLGGKTFELPHMKDVDKAALAVADGEGGQGVLDTLQIALGKQWAAFNRLPLSVDGINKLYDAWAEHSGITPGESEASPRS